MEDRKPKYLKSVDGSFPCQPIFFHCSDIKPLSCSPGKAASQRALKDAYNHAAIEINNVLSQ